jgi:diguanylate cyclase (GGDEF)-like protein
VTRVPRLSLLQRFAGVSLVLVVVLGVLMAQLLATMVSRRALHSATDAAVLMTTVAIQPLLTTDDLANGLPAEKVAALDRAVAGSRGKSEIARIKIWQNDGEVIYLADPHTAAPDHPSTVPSHELAEALGGEIEAQIINASDEPDNEELLARYGTLLEVYVPILYGDDPRPAGVFELYLPYEPVRDSIRADTLRVVTLLAAGLVVLWLGLFHTVASASRRLRDESRRNEYQAKHDPLTGLANRTALQVRIGAAIGHARDPGHSAVLVLLDLDRFRDVNDTLGHGHGDALICEIATRLANHVGDAGVVARLGGDEFAVLLPDVSSRADAVLAAEALRGVLREALEVDGVPLVVEASAGLSMMPDDAADASAMLQHADVAMYVAKRTHRGVVVYDPAEDDHSPERLRLLADLAVAIESGELVLHYQPKVRLDGSLVGVEALVRWQHPERGLLAPVEFIPAAERTGLIHSLTDVVLATAVAQARNWYDEGTPIPVAVNVSTRTLLDSGFADRVMAQLAVHRVAPGLLCLEITETTIMEDPDRARTVLTRLAAAGVRLSIDDFGTGYSSLAYLKTLPVHEIKIDRSFVAAMTSSEPDRVIVDSTVALGRRLGLAVVAEGVEDLLTRDALVALGCELAQGYLFGRPVPASELSVGDGLSLGPALSPSGWTFRTQ